MRFSSVVILVLSGDAFASTSSAAVPRLDFAVPSLDELRTAEPEVLDNLLKSSLGTTTGYDTASAVELIREAATIYPDLFNRAHDTRKFRIRVPRASDGEDHPKKGPLTRNEIFEIASAIAAASSINAVRSDDGSCHLEEIISSFQCPTADNVINEFYPSTEDEDFKLVPCMGDNLLTIHGLNRMAATLARARTSTEFEVPRPNDSLPDVSLWTAEADVGIDREDFAIELAIPKNLAYRQFAQKSRMEALDQLRQKWRLACAEAGGRHIADRPRIAPQELLYSACIDPAGRLAGPVARFIPGKGSDTPRLVLGLTQGGQKTSVEVSYDGNDIFRLSLVAADRSSAIDLHWSWRSQERKITIRHLKKPEVIAQLLLDEGGRREFFRLSENGRDIYIGQDDPKNERIVWLQRFPVADNVLSVPQILRQKQVAIEVEKNELVLRHGSGVEAVRIGAQAAGSDVDQMIAGPDGQPLARFEGAMLRETYFPAGELAYRRNNLLRLETYFRPGGEIALVSTRGSEDVSRTTVHHRTDGTQVTWSIGSEGGFEGFVGFKRSKDGSLDWTVSDGGKSSVVRISNRGRREILECEYSSYYFDRILTVASLRDEGGRELARASGRFMVGGGRGMTISKPSFTLSCPRDRSWWSELIPEESTARSLLGNCQLAFASGVRYDVGADMIKALDRDCDIAYKQHGQDCQQYRPSIALNSTMAAPGDSIVVELEFDSEFQIACRMHLFSSVPHVEARCGWPGRDGDSTIPSAH